MNQLTHTVMATVTYSCVSLDEPNQEPLDCSFTRDSKLEATAAAWELYNGDFGIEIYNIKIDGEVYVSNKIFTDPMPEQSNDTKLIIHAKFDNNPEPQQQGFIQYKDAQGTTHIHILSDNEDMDTPEAIGVSA